MRTGRLGKDSGSDNVRSNDENAAQINASILSDGG
jgi:hypothetical protein